MTKPRCKVDHRSSPSGDLKKVLAELLAKGPQDTYDIARAIGYSVTGVRRHLVVMETAGTVYRQRVITTYGYTHRWHLGDAPAAIPDLEDESCPPPRQLTTRRYPVIGRRDSLVAALFGMASARPSIVLEMEH